MYKKFNLKMPICNIICILMNVTLAILQQKNAVEREYEARTRYVQRNAKRTCSQSQLAIPFAQACPGEQIEHGESCQVTCNPGFDQVEEGNLICSCFNDYGIIRIAKAECEWLGSSPECSQEDVEIIHEFPDATCNSLPDLQDGMWLCPGIGTNAEDLTTCFAQCETNYTIQTHQATREFACGCDSIDDNVECKWSQNPRAIKLHPELIGNDTDSSIFAGDIVWPTCQAIELYEQEPLNSCADLPTVTGGFFQCSNNYFTQSRCSIACNVGYIATNTADLPVLQCRSKQSGAEWNREVVEECLTIATAITNSSDIALCNDPRGETSDAIENFVGDFECNVEVNDQTHYFNGVSCQLTCPVGYKLKRGEDRKTCQCNKRGCKWLLEQAVVCVLDKTLLRNADIWQYVKDLTTSKQQADYISNHFAQLRYQIGDVLISDLRTIITERAIIRKSEIARLGSECPAMAVNTNTTTAKCNGNLPGSICHLRCKKSFNFPSGIPKRSFCACGKRCQWTNWSSCE